jgi:aldehyde dehydrogenase (NAD+)
MMNSKTRINETLERYFGADFAIGSLVDGSIVPGSGETIALRRAHDGKLLFEYADASEGIVSTISLAARRAQQAWWAMTAKERGRILYHVGTEIRKEADHLALIECVTANKPYKGACAEMTLVAEMFEYYAGWTDKLHGSVIPVPTSHLNYVRYEPVGTVFQVTPWNAPLFTCGWQVAPALAAGNAVILKPSELTPLSSLICGSLIERAGAPHGLVNVIAGYGHTIGQAIIANADIRKVCFVGSPATGRHIALAAAEHCIPTILELGGKSANIVFSDANRGHALRGAMSAIFSGSGQSCVSGSRLLVERSIYDDFTADLAKASAKIRVGNPEDIDTEIGPINNAKQYRHVRDMLETAKTEGARVIGQRVPVPESNGYYINPTVLAGDNDMHCAREEIFGPVVVAIPFDDEEDAVYLANDTRFGLAGAVWTNDVARAHRVAARVKAGTFWINGYKTIHVSSPFGGYGESGYGRSSGLQALHDYSEVKSVWVETAENPASSFDYGPEED